MKVKKRWNLHMLTASPWQWSWQSLRQRQPTIAYVSSDLLHYITNFQASSDEQTRKLPLILSRTHSSDTQAAIKLSKCNWRESVKMLFDERRSDAHQSCFHLPCSTSEYENFLDVSRRCWMRFADVCAALPPWAKMEWKATKLKDMGKFTIQLYDHKFNWKSVTRV